MNKRAQFFLLVAVIIVAVVISLGITANQAIVSREPIDFYDFSYEVKVEIGEVIDYGIYSDFDDDAKIDEFVDLLSESIADRDPTAEFVIIYGDSISGVNVRNEREDPIIVDGEEIEGTKSIVVSRICNGNICDTIESPVDEFGEEVGIWEIIASELIGKDTIQIDVEEQTIDFPVSEYKKVLFIIQKDVGDESFVSIK